jgi:hypothetical protein
MKKTFRVVALALLLAAGYAAPANAIQPADVSITEYFDPAASAGFFEVANNSASNTLKYFAVANDAIFEVSANEDWQSYIITRVEWESNGFGFDMSYQLDTSAVDWVTYFGAATSQVAAYASDIGLAPGESSSQFGVSTLVPASRFVAFDQGGAVMASGFTSEVTLAVPEASNAAMFGVGVLMLAWAAGRRRKGGQALLAA